MNHSPNFSFIGGTAIIAIIVITAIANVASAGGCNSWMDKRDKAAQIDDKKAAKKEIEA